MQPPEPPEATAMAAAVAVAAPGVAGDHESGVVAACASIGVGIGVGGSVVALPPVGGPPSSGDCGGCAEASVEGGGSKIGVSATSIEPTGCMFSLRPSELRCEGAFAQRSSARRAAPCALARTSHTKEPLQLA